MAIKHTSSINDLKNHFRKVQKRVDQAIIRQLAFLGEDLVNYARSIPAEMGFRDQTGNLRSSIGYVIVHNGSVIKDDFQRVTGPVQSEKSGIEIGKSYALELSGKHKEGYAMIFVAGMDYALAVESRGRDVLTSTEYAAKRALPPAIRKLKQQIKKMKL